jgi:hypothetical protein
MIRKILIALMPGMMCLPVIAQDTICFNNGEHKAVKLVEVGPSHVSYYRFDNLSGPLFVSDKNDIARIRYANGQVEFLAAAHVDAVDVIAPAKKVPPPHKAPMLMVFGGGGLGLGASVSHGQMRTFYGGDISAVYKHIICTFRYVKSEELQVSPGLLGPDFNEQVSPIENSEERSFLVGYNNRTSRFLFNASAGFSLQNDLVRSGKLLVPGGLPKYESTRVYDTPGFPIEAQAIRHWLCFGLGVKVYANFNRVQTTAGLMFCIRMGYFGLK